MINTWYLVCISMTPRNSRKDTETNNKEKREKKKKKTRQESGRVGSWRTIGDAVHAVDNICVSPPDDVYSMGFNVDPNINNVRKEQQQKGKTNQNEVKKRKPYVCAKSNSLYFFRRVFALRRYVARITHLILL